MPVYGLPLSLEASLNSLVELRPPTSWRVSGHGNDVTVVLRWSLCGSPSSDKTLDYDIDHRPRSSIGTNSHKWTNGLKRTQKQSPATEVKTRCSSTHDFRVGLNNQSKFESFQPLKMRKIENISRISPRQSSPVPVYLTVSKGVFPTPSSDAGKCNLSLSCEAIQISSHGYENPACSSHQSNECDSRHEDNPEDLVVGSISQIPSPIGDMEIRDVIRTYLTPCSSLISPGGKTVLLDEKSGLFTNLTDTDNEDKDESLRIVEPTFTDRMQNDSGCASESNSTSLSHYVKHTLSQDSSSEDGSHYKSPVGSREATDRGSPTDRRCSSSGSSISRSSFAMQSCSSKTKMESFDSSNDNTNLLDEKDDACHSNDLDMICSNDAANAQAEARSVSSRTSISYWDSFDSFQSDQFDGDGEGSDERNKDNATGSS